FSESGKRERFYFKTREEAKTFSEQQKVRIKNHGAVTELLTPAQREAAVAAFRILGDVPAARLIDVVRHHKEMEKQKRASIPVKDLCTHFTQNHAGKSPHYRRQLRTALDRLKAIEKQVIEVAASDLDGLLTDLPASNRNAHLRVFKAAFNFALKKG